MGMELLFSVDSPIHRPHSTQQNQKIKYRLKYARCPQYTDMISALKYMGSWVMAHALNLFTIL